MRVSVSVCMCLFFVFIRANVTWKRRHLMVQIIGNACNEQNEYLKMLDTLEVLEGRHVRLWNYNMHPAAIATFYFLYYKIVQHQVELNVNVL